MLNGFIKICGDCAELFYRNKTEEGNKILDGVLNFAKNNILNLFEGYPNEVIRLFMEKLRVLVKRYELNDSLGIADLLAFELFDFEKNTCLESDENNGINTGSGYFYRKFSLFDRELAGKTFAEGIASYKPYSVIIVLAEEGEETQRLRGAFGENETKELYIVSLESVGSAKMEQRLSELINQHNKELVQVTALPNFDRIYENSYLKLKDRVNYYIKLEKFTKSAELRDASDIGNNILQNMEIILKQSSVAALVNKFRNEDLSEIPAIIVSAGPSLDKNITILKQAEGKAFIIAVDSALRALLDKGIKIDIAISVDPGKHKHPFEHERAGEIPFVFKVNSPGFAVAENKNKIFFEDGYGFRYFSEILRAEAGAELGETKTGGSVANNAFSLVADMGFKTIILVGQDLAYTEGKDHVAGFVNKNELLRNGGQPMLTEAVGGGLVETDMQMSFYREWFEQRIAEFEDIRVIDATEGGALIKGSKIMDLSTAISENCVREFEFDKIISDILPVLSEADRERIGTRLKNIDKEFDELYSRLKSGIRDYERLAEFGRGRGGNENEYRKLLKRLGEINKLEDEVSLLDFTRLFYKAGESGATDDIYTNSSLSVEDIAKKGETLLRGYLEGVKRCREAFASATILQPPS